MYVLINQKLIAIQRRLPYFRHRGKSIDLLPRITLRSKNGNDNLDVMSDKDFVIEVLVDREVVIAI